MLKIEIANNGVKDTYKITNDENIVSIDDLSFDELDVLKHSLNRLLKAIKIACINRDIVN